MSKGPIHLVRTHEGRGSNKSVLHAYNGKEGADTVITYARSPFSHVFCYRFTRKVFSHTLLSLVTTFITDLL